MTFAKFSQSLSALLALYDIRKKVKVIIEFEDKDDERRLATCIEKEIASANVPNPPNAQALMISSFSFYGIKYELTHKSTIRTHG